VKLTCWLCAVLPALSEAVTVRCRPRGRLVAGGDHCGCRAVVQLPLTEAASGRLIESTALKLRRFRQGPRRGRRSDRQRGAVLSIFTINTLLASLVFPAASLTVWAVKKPRPFAAQGLVRGAGPAGIPSRRRRR